MQAWNIAILFLVFHTAISIKNDIKLDKITMKKCSKIQCPPVHEPVCAKLDYNQAGSAYVILINKCEMKYAECHPGVQAKLVPMKFCSHEQTKGHEVNGFGSKRVKRSAKAMDLLYRHKKDANAMDLLYRPKKYSHAMDLLYRPEKYANDKMLLMLPPGKPNEKHAVHATSLKEKGPIDLTSTENKASSKQKGPVDVTSTKDHAACKQKGPVGGISTENQASSKQKGPVDVTSTKDHAASKQKKPGSFTSNEELKSDDKNRPAVFFTHTDDEDVQFVKAFNWRQVYPNSDKFNYQADCPKTCPIRPQMVCGRYNNGIYMTFLSVCHMRMHLCSFKNESIELVARNPCMMSAPLLSIGDTDKKHPWGRADEPTDDDKVLRYIWCRERSYKGAYCQRKTENIQLLKGKDEEKVNSSEDSDNDSMNAEEYSDNPNLPKKGLQKDHNNPTKDLDKLKGPVGFTSSEKHSSSKQKELVSFTSTEDTAAPKQKGPVDVTSTEGHTPFKLKGLEVSKRNKKLKSFGPVG